MDRDLTKITKELSDKREEIIDLFCKTFLCCKGVTTTEELLYIFENYELLIKLGSCLESTVGWEMKLKLKE